MTLIRLSQQTVTPREGAGNGVITLQRSYVTDCSEVTRPADQFLYSAIPAPMIRSTFLYPSPFPPAAAAAAAANQHPSLPFDSQQAETTHPRLPIPSGKLPPQLLSRLESPPLTKQN